MNTKIKINPINTAIGCMPTNQPDGKLGQAKGLDTYRFDLTECFLEF